MERISRLQALQILRSDPRSRVYYTTRDATGQRYQEVPVYLDEDGDLCQSHPTDAGRRCSVPENVQLRVTR